VSADPNVIELLKSAHAALGAAIDALVGMPEPEPEPEPPKGEHEHKPFAVETMGGVALMCEVCGESI
jgi:hypothetical protein